MLLKKVDALLLRDGEGRPDEVDFCIEERRDLENILGVLEADAEKTDITHLGESFVSINLASFNPFRHPCGIRGSFVDTAIPAAT